MWPLVLVIVTASPSDAKVRYWDQLRRGANYFNDVPTEQWFVDAKKAGIKVARMTFTKWKGARRDFLLGDVDHFKKLVPADLARLETVLGWARKHDVKIVLTPLSLPGCRWRQQNDDKLDSRIWESEKYQREAAEFWRQLAARLKDRPEVVGYDLLNEPNPSPQEPRFKLKSPTKLADVNVLNRTISAAIRRVDKNTPIIVEPPDYGSSQTIAQLKPLKDDRVLYSFHSYDPWELVNWRTNQGKYKYPGDIVGVKWDRAKLSDYLEGVVTWSKKHRIPANRIYLGEFGCDRRVEGCAELFRDTISIAEKNGWHWAFYSFREDSWNAMDYELGSVIGNKVRGSNPIWDVLSEGLAKGR